MKKKNKILILAVIIVLMLSTYSIYKYTHTFTRERWDSFPALRTRYIDDFLTKYPIRGMTRDQIIELLGEPESGDLNTMVYTLGGSTFVKIEAIDIYLDESGKVTGYDIFPH